MPYLSTNIEVLHHRYADALIEVAEEAGKLDKVEKDFLLMNKLVRKHEKFAKILFHPEIDKDDKIGFLESLSKKFNFCDEFRSFLKLLARKNRLRFAHGIFLKYRDLYDVRKRRQKVFVTTAVSLGTKGIKNLKAILEAALKKDIFIEEIIEPSLIGGFDLRIGDRVYNLSVANRLKIVKERLVKAWK